MTTAPDDGPAPSWHSRYARLHPATYAGVHGVVGALVTAALLWIFIALADEIPERGALTRLDTAVAAWLESHGTERGESFFVLVSYLGAPVVAASVIAVLGWFLWERRWRQAVAIALTTSGGLVLGTVLKLVFHRGRPETAAEFITRQSWSFPSGHALNSMIGYGVLAVLLLDRTSDPRRRVAIVAAATLLVGIIGFSRLYLGVHYLSDVVGGWVAGLAWLLVCVSGYRVIERQRTRPVTPPSN